MHKHMHHGFPSNSTYPPDRAAQFTRMPTSRTIPSIFRRRTRIRSTSQALRVPSIVRAEQDRAPLQCFSDKGEGAVALGQSRLYRLAWAAASSVTTSRRIRIRLCTKQVNSIAALLHSRFSRPIIPITPSNRHICSLIFSRPLPLLIGPAPDQTNFVSEMELTGFQTFKATTSSRPVTIAPHDTLTTIDLTRTLSPEEDGNDDNFCIEELSNYQLV